MTCNSCSQTTAWLRSRLATRNGIPCRLPGGRRTSTTVSRWIAIGPVQATETTSSFSDGSPPISPEKRPHVAIDIARRAGVRLVIAAKVDAADRRYFEEIVRPRLSDPLVDFVGEVDEQAKGHLLRHARALLFPILWPEPFGLAMAEALAYGTPVITRRCGSTPEVVAHGRVGYVCDDDDAVVEAVKQVERINRAECRRWMEAHFSVERMTADYERLYETLAADHTDSLSVSEAPAHQAA